ncbi:MAG: PQQ-binding-like beta-propeller repeat protein [Pirellulaceae bacterium]|nr:PQQ-binding-like beta-propeller repeat protein [Pirellulaceae bacterium]
MRSTILLWSAALLWAALVSGGQSASGGDWAHWRGPEQNGVSREKGLIEDWSLEPRKNVIWESPIGGRAAPVVMNGRIYLNCRTSDDVNDPVQKIHAREQVICRDANTGEVIWTDVFNVFQTDIPAPRVGWASMVGDPETGNVFVHSVSGIFRCYDPDGKVQWEYSLFEDYGKISGYGGRTQTPIIDEDRIIVSFLVRNWGEYRGPGPKHAFFAFDKHDGKLLWVSTPGESPEDTNYSCPVVAVINGVRMLICGVADGAVYGINARTGEKIWGFRMSKRGLNATPVVDGNLVYMSHGEDNIDTLKFGRVQCIDGTGTGDVTETHGVWRVDDVKAGYTGLLVKDGILYVVADTGRLYAYDSKTGQQLWTHSLGTVGKGSPVWADGKLYVMEVNGKIHILRPSREGCESLSVVELLATDGTGYDEIYASPAIANGKIYLVTRDRTLCLGDTSVEPSSDPVPPLPEESPAGEEIAHLQLIPYEALVAEGGEISYELRAFDKNGRFIKTLEPQLEPQEDLSAAQVQGTKLVFAADAPLQAGHVVAKHGDLTATARVRVFPPLPWQFDFEGLPPNKTIPGWLNGEFPMLKPTDLDGSKVLLRTVPPSRPSNWVWIGPSNMRGYTIQSDVMMKELRRQLPSAGITAQRYNFIIKGNYAKVAVQSWQPHLRMAKEVKYRTDPDVWYTLKMRVDIENDQAIVRGKIWKRGEPEPDAWTVEAIDPHPNLAGSPGLFQYSLADCYFDNVMVTKDE